MHLLPRLALACVCCGWGMHPAAEEAKTPEPESRPNKPRPKPTDKPAKPKYEPEVQYLLDLAHVHRQYGHLEEALPLLDRAFEKERDQELRIDILQLAGETALAEPNRAAAAAGYFTRAAELCKDEERVNLLRLWLGGAWRTAKDYAKAESAFWAAYRGFADKRQQQDALRQFTEIVRKPERAEAAAAEYEKRLAAKADDTDALEALSLIYAAGPRKDLTRALAVQEKLCALHPDNLDERQKLAVLYQQAGQADKAVDLYRVIVAQRPSELEKLARALAQANRKEEAAASALKLLEGQEENPKTLEYVALMLDQFGLPKDALNLRYKAVRQIKDERERMEAQLRILDRLRELKDFQRAEELARGLLKDAANTQPPADARPEEAKAFQEQRSRVIGRLKKALVQLYEDQGRLGDLQF